MFYLNGIFSWENLFGWQEIVVFSINFVSLCFVALCLWQVCINLFCLNYFIGSLFMINRTFSIALKRTLTLCRWVVNFILSFSVSMITFIGSYLLHLYLLRRGVFDITCSTMHIRGILFNKSRHWWKLRVVIWDLIYRSPTRWTSFS